MRFLKPFSPILVLAALGFTASHATKFARSISLAPVPAFAQAAPPETSDPAPSDPAPVDPGISPNVQPTPQTAALTTRQQEYEARLRDRDKALSAGLKGRLLRVATPYSAHLKRKVAAWVYLPPGYEQSTARYPVAYILHGAPGEGIDCFSQGHVHRVAESMILSHRISPLILVGWDGQGPGGAEDITNFLNRRDGYDMEDFVVQDLVPWVDQTYRTVPDARSRAMIGFSAGGYGAINLGLKHPDVWNVLASHAGFFDPEDDFSEMTKILGPISTSLSLWQANNPLLLARQLGQGTRLHLYMDVGRSDPLLSEFKKMAAELKARHVDFKAHVFAGAHSWKYLSLHYRNSLLFADQSWKEMARG